MAPDNTNHQIAAFSVDGRWGCSRLTTERVKKRMEAQRMLKMVRRRGMERVLAR